MRQNKYKNTKIGRIPKDWELGRLSDITESFLNGGTPNTNIKKYWNGNIPWITGTDVVETILFPTRRFITEEGLLNSSSNLVNKGSILIVTRTGVGKIALAGCDLAISQDLTGVVLDKSIAHNLFYLYYLKRHAAKYISLAQGTTIGGILRRDVANTLIPIININEQRKIAEILSTVDEAIEKTDTIIKETQQLKKGLMQKLFTEGIGHTKFKDTKIGRIPEAWEVIKFRKVLLKVEQKDPKNRSEDFFTYVDVSAVSNHLLKIINAKVINKVVAPSRARKIICTDDTIYATVRPYLKRIALVPPDLNGEVCSTGFCVIRPNKSAISEQYVFQLMLTDRVNDYLTSLQTGTSYPAINDFDIYDMFVPKPELSEQNEIANILFEVDSKIDKECDTRLELEHLKKGLMQVLLTGKVRVKV